MMRLTNFAMAGGRAIRVAAAVTLACGVLNACGSSSSGTAPSTSTTLVGVIADSAENGSLTITIPLGTLTLAPPTRWVATLYAASVVNVTGTLAIQGGPTIALTGTYDTGTHTLSLSGGGYAFTGTYANGVLSGTFTNPKGATGGFTTQSGSTTSVVAYCGTYTGTGNGYFNVTVNFSTNQITGFSVEYKSNSDRSPLTGTVSGNSLTVNYPAGNGVTGTATGTFGGTNKSTISGTYSDPSGGQGTFSGSRCS